ncbi:hypothetical protein DER45DRAFT_553084 [Fusarium avenaceum]|nr:hypothetical protein DER45DRAFT_553084 [Fusarium avenaceum]
MDSLYAIVIFLLLLSNLNNNSSERFCEWLRRRGAYVCHNICDGRRASYVLSRTHQRASTIYHNDPFSRLKLVQTVNTPETQSICY